jgi:hypothetical protein
VAAAFGAGFFAATGFLAAGFFATGFLVVRPFGFAVAGVNSAVTGFGRKRGGSPVETTGASASLSVS